MRILRLAAFRTPLPLPPNLLDGETVVRPLPLQQRLRLLFSQRSNVSSALGTDGSRETEPQRPSSLHDLQEERRETRVGRSGSYEYRRNQHAVRLLQVTVTEGEPRLS